MNMSEPSPVSPPAHSFSMTRVLLVAIPLGILCGWLMKSYWPQHIEAETSRSSAEKLGSLMFGGSGDNRLDPQFTDADSDLVADCPKDPSKQIAPATVVFAYIAGPNAKAERNQWQPLADFLSNKTGKKVEIASYNTIAEQMDALKTGKLHVAGFNTGAVENAVNKGGFVPVCTPGKDDGKFGIRMQVIVPAKSTIRTLADLKNHTITFTDRSSNSGYKAALLKLHDLGLLPQQDYLWRFSGSHEDSIKQIAASEAEVAPVASDMLQLALAKGDINKDDVRVIEESDNFPPGTLGYVYNLEPELAGKVRSALLEFSWTGTTLDNHFRDATHFVPVSYKKDFELIRRIDDNVKSPPDAATVEPAGLQEPANETDTAPKAG